MVFSWDNMIGHAREKSSRGKGKGKRKRKRKKMFSWDILGHAKENSSWGGGKEFLGVGRGEREGG